MKPSIGLWILKLLSFARYCAAIENTEPRANPPTRDSTSRPEFPYHLIFLIAVPFVAILAGCPNRSVGGVGLSATAPNKLATEKPAEYRQLVSAFNSAVVALKV